MLKVGQVRLGQALLANRVTDKKYVPCLAVIKPIVGFTGRNIQEIKTCLKHTLNRFLSPGYLSVFIWQIALITSLSKTLCVTCKKDTYYLMIQCYTQIFHRLVATSAREAIVNAIVSYFFLLCGQKMLPGYFTLSFKKYYSAFIGNKLAISIVTVFGQ